MRIGERVLALLYQNKELSQAGLASHLGVSPSTVNGWKEKNRNPSSDLIVPICEYLGVSEYFLLTGIDKQPERSKIRELPDDLIELETVYQQLDERGKSAVRGSAFSELTRVERLATLDVAINPQPPERKEATQGRPVVPSRKAIDELMGRSQKSTGDAKRHKSTKK